MPPIEILELQLELLEQLTGLLQPHPLPFTHESAEIDAGGPRARGVVFCLEILR